MKVKILEETVLARKNSLHHDNNYLLTRTCFLSRYRVDKYVFHFNFYVHLIYYRFIETITLTKTMKAFAVILALVLCLFTSTEA